MAEQCLSSSTDIPSSLYSVKESNSLDTLHVDSLIRRSLLNQTHTTIIESPPPPPSSSAATTVATNSSASSTASLTIYCIETGSVAQSIRRRQSLTNPIGQSNNIEITPCIDEGRLLDEHDKSQILSRNARKLPIFNNDENDWLDTEDDDEMTVDEIIDPKPFPIPPNYVSSPCPICFEQAVLQVSPCCYFLCCNTCWRGHISSTINDGRIKIPCVANGCNKFLTRESIVNFVRYDPPLHDRYMKLYLIANQNPRAKTCPRCCHLYSLDAINVTSSSTDKKKSKKADNKKIPKQVQCSECSLVWCFRCSAPWHENLTCKQFIKGDKLLLKWINQKNEEQWNARKCPKCSSLIQRAGGCPHMTCQSCSCEFCYLCGRRYVSIPLIGQHSNKFSMFGCPYNFYPEKPWLRRTIRGVIATGVVVASPVIIAGVVTAAITVLPPFGIYKLVNRIRSRRRGHQHHDFPVGEPFLIEPNLDVPQTLIYGGLPFDFHGNLGPDDILRLIRERNEQISMTSTIDENDNLELNEKENDINFPLSIFANMDIEHLFLDNDDELNNSPLDFRTCPTTPASTLRKGHSRSLNQLTTNYYSSIHRHHSITTEH